MKDVLFICKSNVNRSQQAEGFYNAIKEGKAISAATEIDKDIQKPSEKCIVLMKEKGINLSRKKSTLIKKNMLNGVKKVVAICPKSFLPKYVLNFQDLEVWRVRDPCYHTMSERRKIRNEIEKRVAKLAKEFGR